MTHIEQPHSKSIRDQSRVYSWMWYLPCTTTHHRALAKWETIHRQKKEKENPTAAWQSVLFPSFCVCMSVASYFYCYLYGIWCDQYWARSEQVRLKQDLVVLSVSLFTVTGDPGVPGCHDFHEGSRQKKHRYFTVNIQWEKWPKILTNATVRPEGLTPPLRSAWL